MKAVKLAGLEPCAVFGYFEELCAIPHGSGNTKAISDYLAAFAKEQGIACIQDDMNNIFLFQPGTPGYEDHAPVILQGHMDMVCEKDPDCPIDMAAQGIEVTHDGQWVFANGTTLGGDDGIAVAYCMALLADRSIPHPPLEVLITVDEETGMYGAEAADLSVLKGSRLINLDSEEEGIFTVSCAGGARVELTVPAARKAVYGPCVRLTVEGLQGGHSGAEIHKRRANANKVMGELLGRIQELMPLSLTGLRGGSKDNAIPRSCTAAVVTLGIHPERINDITEELQQKLRTEYDEPEAVVRGDNLDALGGNALSTQDTARVIALLNSLPNGVQSYCPDMEGLVQTSLNLGIIRLQQELKLTLSVRSSVDSEKQELLDRLKELSQFHGAEYQQDGDYPAWEYRKDSPLRDTMVRVYREQYGREPQVIAIHAGLECGLFSRKRKDLDCVSIGPDMENVHTSRERLHIASVARTWELLQQVLKEL